jgi:hypothetical protein
MVSNLHNSHRDFGVQRGRAMLSTCHEMARSDLPIQHVERPELYGKSIRLALHQPGNHHLEFSDALFELLNLRVLLEKSLSPAEVNAPSCTARADKRQ